MVGQEHAKKVLSVATYNHYKRLSSNLPPVEEGGSGSGGSVIEPMNIPPTVLDPSGPHNTITVISIYCVSTGSLRSS